VVRCQRKIPIAPSALLSPHASALLSPRGSTAGPTLRRSSAGAWLPGITVERDLEPDWTRAELVLPGPRQSVHLRLEPEVVDYFKAGGKGHITRMQAVLRADVGAQRRCREARRATDLTPCPAGRRARRLVGPSSPASVSSDSLRARMRDLTQPWTPKPKSRSV